MERANELRSANHFTAESKIHYKIRQTSLLGGLSSKNSLVLLAMQIRSSSHFTIFHMFVVQLCSSDFVYRNELEIPKHVGYFAGWGGPPSFQCSRKVNDPQKNHFFVEAMAPNAPSQNVETDHEEITFSCAYIVRIMTSFWPLIRFWNRTYMPLFRAYMKHRFEHFRCKNELIAYR